MTTNTEQSEIIEGLTSKLQEAEIKLAETILESQHDAAQSVVTAHVVAGMSLGLMPIPLFDIATLTGTQINMLRNLCQNYDINFDENIGKSLLNALVSGSLPVLAVMGLSSIAKFIPGVGSVAGGLSVSVLSGAMVYASGQVFIKHFEAGGTLDDFDSKQWAEYFKEQFEEGKTFAKGQYNKSKDALSESVDEVKNKFSKKPEDASDEETTVTENVTENVTKTETAPEVAAENNTKEPKDKPAVAS